MAVAIPIQAVPSQQVLAVLGGQNVQISIYQKSQGIFVDINSNGIDLVTAALALNAVGLDSHLYDGFIGNLMFLDTQGFDDPVWGGLGSRFQLVYLNAAEYAIALIPNPLLYEDLAVTIPTIPNVLVTDDGDTIITNTGAVIEVVYS